MRGWVRLEIMTTIASAGNNFIAASALREPLIKWEGHSLHSKEAAGKAATREHPRSGL